MTKKKPYPSNVYLQYLVKYCFVLVVATSCLGWLSCSQNPSSNHSHEHHKSADGGDVPKQIVNGSLDAPFTTKGIVLVNSVDDKKSGWKAKFFRHGAYHCGVKGSQTFLVLNPPGKDWKEPLPLWMSLHGGGLAAFNKSGEYIPVSLKNSKLMNETSSDLLLRRFVHGAGADDWKTPGSSWPPKGGINAHIVASGKFRILLPSMCDNDVYSGVGTPDPNNPNQPAGQKPMVDGLLAIRAALQYVRDNFPISKTFLRGCSAGSVGVLTLVHRLSREKEKIAGVIADSAVISDYWRTIYDFSKQGNTCFSWHVSEPSFHDTRVGPYMLSKNRIENNMDKILSPLYLVWSTGDVAFCGKPHTAKVFEAVHNAVKKHNPGGASVAREVCTDKNCSRHCPTNQDSPLNKEIFDWVLKRLAR